MALTLSRARDGRDDLECKRRKEIFFYIYWPFDFASAAFTRMGDGRDASLTERAAGRASSISQNET